MEENKKTTILGSVFGLFSNFIKAPFSYLYNKLNHYNYTIQGTFNRANKNNGQFSPEGLRAIDQYLKKGFNPDFTLKGGKTPLMVATQAQNLGLVKSLLHSNANVDASDKDGTPILIMAIRAGNNELIKLLLEYNANVDQRDMRRAPLTWAVKLENFEAIKMLCNAGASLVVDPQFDTTIFHFLDDRPEEYYATIMTHARFAENIVHMDCKNNTILYYVDKRIRGLKKLLQMKSQLSKKTALERLVYLHETEQKYDESFITRMTELLNGTKLDADFEKLKKALTEMYNSEQTKKSTPVQVIPLLCEKLDQDNLALGIYKSAVHSLLPFSISIYSL